MIKLKSTAERQVSPLCQETLDNERLNLTECKLRQEEGGAASRQSARTEQQASRASEATVPRQRPAKRQNLTAANKELLSSIKKYIMKYFEGEPFIRWLDLMCVRRLKSAARDMIMNLLVLLLPYNSFLATLIWRVVAALAHAVRGLIRALPERPGKMEKSRKTHIKLPALKRSEFPWALDDTPCLSGRPLNNAAVSFGKFGRFGRAQCDYYVTRIAKLKNSKYHQVTSTISDTKSVHKYLIRVYFKGRKDVSDINAGTMSHNGRFSGAFFFFRVMLKPTNKHVGHLLVRMCDFGELSDADMMTPPEIKQAAMEVNSVMSISFRQNFPLRALGSRTLWCATITLSDYLV
ncbi:hypothetical protein MSG28_002133 [Choristoneura fumiferana]|uniref:Uncharacterized protein n=1 Tax=Choristoneura fumiferana TaxID=7141 RepID=A0ACC0JU74_CHOFU|nr:hypothetical protein MSG28_002133 [Choristoneura fumiferana]